MKKLFVFFLILFVAIGLGFWVQHGTGYVMVVYQHWVLTTNIWVALFSLIIAFLFLYTVIRFLKTVLVLPKKIRAYSRTQRAHKKQQLFMTALSSFALGKYAVAEKNFVRSISKNTPAALHYLGAAYCAQREDAIVKRNKYLFRALQKAQTNHLAVTLTEAELYLEHNESAKALALLTPALAQYPQNIRLLQLLSICFQKENAWESWLNLLPQFKKQSIFSEEKLDQLERRAYSHVLATSLKKGEVHQFEKTWESLPKKIKKNADIVKIYLQYCTSHQPPQVALSFIETLLKKEWDPDLLLFYVKNTTQDKEILNTQLQMAEHWLKKQDESAKLLAVLAYLSLKANFPGKASDYATKALSKEMDTPTTLLLADVYNQLGDKNQAIICYQRAINALF